MARYRGPEQIRELSPISDMMLLAGHIASGDYAHRVATRGSDELVRLAESLNRMAVSLQRIEFLRRDLVANVAHELRAPLNILQGYLEGMRDGVVPIDRNVLGSLHEEVLRLVRLVDTLQHPGRFDARISSPRLTPLDATVLARRVVALYDLQLRARGLSLDVLTRTAGPVLHADPDLVEQALRNLIDNAVRYASVGTNVTIRISPCAGGVAFAVENLGEEIAPDELPHIFERFYRGAKSRSRDTGAGIGLALVQEIARGHGGEAGAESAGGRTTVWFRLPTGHPARGCGDDRRVMEDRPVRDGQSVAK